MVREPFDVGKTVDYVVQLSNAAHTMRYDVEFTVGPDINDPGISKSYQNSVSLQSGQSGSVNFPVNFQAPDFRASTGFREWLSEMNQTSPWEEAWYKVVVTSLDPFEKPVTLEDYTGKPTLIKLLEEFRGAEVNPRAGTMDDFFNYKVSVFSTAQDNITLEVGPSRNGPWTVIGPREYGTVGTWQNLEWSNVTLGFDFTYAYYRFVGRKQAIFEGPSWPVEVQFRNVTLTPSIGLASTPFNYSLEINASKEIEVGLNAWDVVTESFVLLEKLPYNNTSTWQNLTWTEVNPTSQSEASGTSNFYFSFHHLGADKSFTTTYEETGKYYPGPDIVVIRIYNQNVTPTRGTIYTPYSYIVQVDTPHPRCDIELLIAAPGSKIYDSRGTVTYRGENNTLSWPGRKFDPDTDVLGNASYWFKWGDMVLGEFQGPDIDVTFRNVTWNRIGNTDRFNYKVSVKSSRPQLNLELIYTDDGVTWVRSGIMQEYNAQNQTWVDLTWANQPWHQTVRFDVVR